MSELQNMSEEDEDAIRGILEDTGLVTPHHIRRLNVTYMGVDGQLHQAVFEQDQAGTLAIQSVARGESVDSS